MVQRRQSRIFSNASIGTRVQADSSQFATIHAWSLRKWVACWPTATHEKFESNITLLLIETFWHFRALFEKFFTQLTSKARYTQWVSCIEQSLAQDHKFFSRTSDINNILSCEELEYSPPPVNKKEQSLWNGLATKTQPVLTSSPTEQVSDKLISIDIAKFKSCALAEEDLLANLRWSHRSSPWPSKSFGLCSPKTAESC